MRKTTTTIALAIAAWMAGAAIALDAPKEVGIYEPVLVKHAEGASVQILPWGTQVPSYLPEQHIKRFETHTVFCAKPGAYLVVGDGDLAIVLIKGESPGPGPGPNPGPGPEPEPGPEPNPGPEPEPGPDPDIPPDEFGNVGRIARQALKEVSAQDRSRYQAKIKETYARIGKVLRDPRNGVLSLNDARRYTQEQFELVFAGANKGTWEAWAKRMNEHAANVSFTRRNYAGFCDAIAAGL